MIKPVSLKNISLTDLFQEEHISSWRTLVDILMKYPNDSMKLWRGQGNSAWSLTSSYRRAFDTRMSQQTEAEPFAGLGFLLPFDYENLCRNTFVKTDDSIYHLSRSLNFAWSISSGDDRAFYRFLNQYKLNTSYNYLYSILLNSHRMF